MTWVKKRLILCVVGWNELTWVSFDWNRKRTHAKQKAYSFYSNASLWLLKWSKNLIQLREKNHFDAFSKTKTSGTSLCSTWHDSWIVHQFTNDCSAWWFYVFHGIHSKKRMRSFYPSFFSILMLIRWRQEFNLRKKNNNSLCSRCTVVIF